MNEFKTAVTAAVIAAVAGALAGGLIAFGINEKNITEARQSQKAELEAFTKQWGKQNSQAANNLELQRQQIGSLSKSWSDANAQTDSQISLMKENIEEMQKSYLFQQEKHRAEMKAVYEMIRSSSNNTEMLIAQQEKLAVEENKQRSSEKWQRSRASMIQALSNFLEAAEVLRAAQVTLQHAFCNTIDNTQIVSSSSNGLTNTSRYPITSYDCTPRANAEREFNTARAKFTASLHVALSKANKADRGKIETLKNALNFDEDKLDQVSDERFGAAITSLRKSAK